VLEYAAAYGIILVVCMWVIIDVVVLSTYALSKHFHQCGYPGMFGVFFFVISLVMSCVSAWQVVPRTTADKILMVLLFSGQMTILLHMDCMGMWLSSLIWIPCITSPLWIAWYYGGFDFLVRQLYRCFGFDETEVFEVLGSVQSRPWSTVRAGAQIFRSGAFGVAALTHHGVFVGRFELAEASDSSQTLRENPSLEDRVVDTAGRPGEVKIRIVSLRDFVEETRNRTGSSSSFGFSSSSSRGPSTATDDSISMFTREYQDQMCGADGGVLNALRSVSRDYNYDIVTRNCEAFAYACVTTPPKDFSLENFSGASSPQGHLGAGVCSIVFAILLAPLVYWERTISISLETDIVELLLVVLVALRWLYWLSKLLAAHAYSGGKRRSTTYLLPELAGHESHDAVQTIAEASASRSSIILEAGHESHDAVRGSRRLKGLGRRLGLVLRGFCSIRPRLCSVRP